MAIYAISTGIAIIPESLIAVLTITMVVGMTTMRKRMVVVRHLSALEALGGVTNVCSDKTGTLTQGKMTTKKVWIPKAGVYSVEHSNNASDPTDGKVTLDPNQLSQSEAQAKKQATADALDRKRSVAGVHFDGLEEKVSETPTESQNDEEIEENPKVQPGLQAFLESAALCNLSTLRKTIENGQEEWKAIGEPTEIALQVFAHRFDRGKHTLEADHGWKQVMEFPFDSSIKRMSVVYWKRGQDSSVVFTKGAAERVLELCNTIGVGDETENLTQDLKHAVLDQMELLAERGLRVLAVARKFTKEQIEEHSDIQRSEVEKDLCLLGLAGLYDPPRLETKTAIQACAAAGIQVTMLTGDHLSTATAIAKDVGIIPRNLATLSHAVATSIVMPASEFDKMSDDEIDALPTLPLVIARCAPDTKVRMVEALHRRGKYAAMTGDGVNDSPSLKMADVGIAMGMNGSDVAKSASDIVLTDDNFASIVNAIEEGRRMFDNIQKFVLHLLASNVGEVILLICGLGFQDSHGFSVFPLSPLQILWINMLTSSFPAFGLGREKASSAIMRRPPHNTKKGVFTWELVTDMIVYGMMEGTLAMMTFVFIVYGPGRDGLGEDCNRSYNDSCDVVFRARAAVFAELTWLILISAWEFKSLRQSLFALDPNHTTRRVPFFHDIWENQFLFWSVVLGALSVFPAVYIPGLNRDVFKHTGISWEWAPAVICVFLFVLGMESWKFTKRRTGWFAPDRVSNAKDSTREIGPLSLKQGFFSMARSFSRTKSESRSQDTVVAGQVIPVEFKVEV